jgi:hypothetical protein
MADHLGPFTRRRPSAHRPWQALLAVLVAERHREWRAQGYDERANALARMAAHGGVASLFNEFKRRKGTGDYLRPTMAALLWRDLRLRRWFQRHLQHKQALEAFRWAAHDEAAARAICAANVLFWLAEAVTAPRLDESTKRKIVRHMRHSDKHRHAWRLLWANGLKAEAEMHFRQALKHLLLANDLDWKPDPDQLVYATCDRLWRRFGYRCYGIATRLVSAALDLKGDEEICPRHTRHVVNFFNQ